MKYAKQYPIDHNDVVISRGKWRKYNPYKPYVEEEEPEKNNTIQSIDNMLEEKPQVKSINNSQNTSNTQKYNDSPALPMEDEPINISAISSTDDSEIEQIDLDIQKELEHKFDEIFGAFETDDNTSNV